MIMKKIKKLIFCLFVFLPIIVSASDTTTYMGCGDNIGIAYDVPGVVRAVISIIKFMAPILIILLGSVDLFKVVFSGEKDELNKLAVNVKENVLNQLGKGSLDILNEGLNDVNGYVEARLEQVLVDIKKEQ